MEIKHLLKPILFILIGVTARTLPHPANFTPVGAIALFGSRFLDKKMSFIVPIITMLISDAIIGFGSISMRITVYTTLIIISYIGFELRNTVQASLTASVIFFITTNFSVWAFGSMYTKDLSGLISSYFMAIPFFGNTVLGDLFYSTLLISLPSWLRDKRVNVRNIFRPLFISK